MVAIEKRDTSEFGQGTGQGEICRRNKTFDIS